MSKRVILILIAAFIAIAGAFLLHKFETEPEPIEKDLIPVKRTKKAEPAPGSETVQEKPSTDTVIQASDETI